MNEDKPRTYLEIFADLIHDRQVSHGAFRLWHALRDYTNAQSACWPGQRRLADDIGCNIHSLKSWTHELTAAKWLRVQRTGHGCGFTYFVLNGKGELLRKSATPSVAESGNRGVAKNSNRGVAESGNGLLRKVATKVSSPINQVQLREKSPVAIEGEDKSLTPTQEITAQKKLERYEAERSRITRNAGEDAMGMKRWTERERNRLDVLAPEIIRLKRLLGIV